MLHGKVSFSVGHRRTATRYPFGSSRERSLEGSSGSGPQGDPENYGQSYFEGGDDSDMASAGQSNRDDCG
jgi:hypothetical protein